MPPEENQRELQISVNTIKMGFAIVSGVLALGTSLGGVFYIKFQLDENTRQIAKLQTKWEGTDVVDQTQTKQLAALEPKLDSLVEAVREVKQILRDREKTKTQ